MKLTTEPIVKDGAPFVGVKIGSTSLELTAAQAEEIAEALYRAATAARYEAGLVELLTDKGSEAQATATVTELRAKIEARRHRRN